ncbi:MAG: D-tyrosyl-tRNA(Tyr) deacylase [Planctomycetes bacterium]|nr:D-tyrosyl-tRNA(Tyr) deacylase [Planctomycetota bacterium]
MITIVQRVSRAEVRVAGSTVGRIGAGALLLLGVEEGDLEADALTTAQKLARLRFFPGRTPMDLTLGQVGGQVLLVSQFTLAAGLDQGNRPSFTRAAPPAAAEALYDRVGAELRRLGLEVATGRFAAHMEVELVNDGPVTFVLRVRGGRVD